MKKSAIKDALIFIFWDTGWESAPSVCKVCLAALKKFNPNSTIICLDNKSIESYIPCFIRKYNWLFQGNLIIQHKTDLFRLALLQKYGGIWIDSTVICTKAFESWLPNYSRRGFFVFPPSAKTKSYLCSNWFIYADPNHPIISAWQEKLLSIFLSKSKDQTSINYFSMHIAFTTLMQDVSIRHLWDQNPKFCSRDPTIFIDGNPTIAEIIEAAKDCPVFKLNHSNGYIKQDILGSQALQSLLKTLKIMAWDVVE